MAKVKTRSWYAKCKACGTYFETTGPVYCSAECKAAREIAYNKPQERYESRPFTPLTVYLVHKWVLEGMTAPDVSELLERPQEDIERALASKLSKAQQGRMLQYLYERVSE